MVSLRRNSNKSRLPPALLAAILLLLASPLPSTTAYDWRYENEGKRIVRSKGKLNNKAAKEISGVVASRSQTAAEEASSRDGGNSTTAGGVLWSHNDSGSGPLLFAMNASTGQHIAWFELRGDNIPHSDWEDIAIGPGPIFGQDYLYVGDIGNARGHGNKIIRLPEPRLPHFGKAAVVRSFDDDHKKVNPSDPWDLVPIHDFEVIEFRYPGGKHHNCESLTVDPITGDIFVAAKHNNRLDVYVLHYRDLDVAKVNELRLHYSSCNDWKRTGTEDCEYCDGCADSIADYNTITAADISPSGYGLIMSDYTHVFYWKRQFLNESFFEHDPVQLPYQNRHGTEEALAWSSDSKGYFIVPEGSYPELRFYPYNGQAWFDEVRDHLSSCWAFIHVPSDAISRIRTTSEGLGTPQDAATALGSAVSSCLPVPCSEVSVQKEEVAANMVSFFENKESCESWQKFYDRMVNHDVDWLTTHNKIDFVNVDSHEEYSFIHDDITDLIEQHYRGFERALP